jgi:hypothetical protein
MAMVVYRVVALLADLNTLPCVNTHGYQTSDASATEVANHFSPFLAIATHKKGIFHATQGRNTPYKKRHKKAATAASLCVVVFVVKRSVCYGCACYATATFSRFRLRFSLVSASVGSACTSAAGSCCSFALSLTIGMTTT